MTTGVALQVRNDELVNILAAEFQRRYEPNFAWVNACPAHLALCGLRGFWPMSSVGDAGSAVDISGQGRALARNNHVRYDWGDLAWWAEFDGTDDYLDRADEAGLDILGTEAYSGLTKPGLSLGCWVKFDRLNGPGNYFVMSKQGGVASADISYSLMNPAGTNVLRFTISDGLGVISTVDTAAITTGIWYHVVGVFSNSNNTVSLMLDGVKTSAASAIAAINNTAYRFMIGARDNGAGAGTLFMDGNVSMAFLCVGMLGDSQGWSLHQQTRALFGV